MASNVWEVQFLYLRLAVLFYFFSAVKEFFLAIANEYLIEWFKDLFVLSELVKIVFLRISLGFETFLTNRSSECGTRNVKRRVLQPDC